MVNIIVLKLREYIKLGISKTRANLIKYFIKVYSSSFILAYNENNLLC